MTQKTCVRSGCGLPASVKLLTVDGDIEAAGSICSCCAEVLTNWLKGNGEFHHGTWEAKMLNENLGLLEQLEQLKSPAPRKRWWQR